MQKEISSIFGQASAKALHLATIGLKAATEKIEAIKLTRKKPKKMSKAGRAKIAAAQKARWAKIKAGKGKASAPAATKEKPAKKKGKMSAKGLANIRAAQKARWAKVKAEKN